MSDDGGVHRKAERADPIESRVNRAFDDGKPQGTVFVGFSGGLDSTVLLHALATQCPHRVCALHAHHGLHSDADRWLAHCQSLCEVLQVPLRSASLTVSNQGKGLEAAARAARYQWFESCLGVDDRLFLAHHQDDQVETLLLRLLRGAGPQGLAAMASSRSIGKGQLCRPLLDLPRAVLQRYAQSQSLSWIDDPSNTDLRFDRNFLRAEVLPLLEQRWPGYRKTMARAAAQLRELENSLPAAELATCYSPVGDPGFFLESLPRDAIAAARSLRAWLRGLALSMPSTAMLGEFQRQLIQGKRARMATRDWVLERYRDAVYAYLPWQLADSGPWGLDHGDFLDVGGSGRVGLQLTNQALKRPERQHKFELRFRQGGERLRRQAGHSSELKQVFQALGVPPWWRDRMPLLFCMEESGAELLAVGSLERSSTAIAEGISLRWQPMTLGSR